MLGSYQILVMVFEEQAVLDEDVRVRWVERERVLEDLASFVEFVGGDQTDGEMKCRFCLLPQV